MLKQAGFDVTESGSGWEALRLATERKPQLVILDIQLPDISGLEVCQRLKNSPATACLQLASQMQMRRLDEPNEVYRRVNLRCTRFSYSLSSFYSIIIERAWVSLIRGGWTPKQRSKSWKMLERD